MNDEAPRLTEAAEKALALPPEKRIEYIQRDRWIGYDVAKEVIDRMEALLNHPPVQRTPNLLLIGETNNGKTSILQRFRARHPPKDDFLSDEAVSLQVLYIELEGAPSEDGLYCQILSALFSPFKYSMPTPKKRELVYRLFDKLGIRMLIIDEMNNLLASRKDKQQTFLNAVKRMGNVLQVPIVAAGVIEAARAIHTDPQMANRFEPFALPLWRDDERYWRLLASFERMLPLKEPSDLVEERLAGRILSISEGRLGEISQLLKNAAVYAVREGTERIDEKALKSFKWVPPSKRRQAAELLV